MFSGQREFRVIVFASKLKSVREAVDLLQGDVKNDLRVVLEERDLTLYHGFYYSETPFCDPARILNIKEIVDGIEKYRYDFYGCEIRDGRHVRMALAVPFSSMAKEMFGKVIERAKNRHLRFIKLNLERLISMLLPGGQLIDTFIATSARFWVDGGDSIKTVVFSGTDVITSKLYMHAYSKTKGLRLVARRIRLKYNDFGQNFSFESDIHGNFFIRVNKEGTNLGVIHQVLQRLEQSEAIVETMDSPLRRGVEGDENVHD